MKNLMIALDMCFGMFTAIPFPHGEWREELRKVSVALLPMAGLVIGGLWLLLAYLARLLLPVYISGAVMAAVPFVLTGFMHLDGYMDTSDAILSWRSQEERVRILKDVHCGSFAVVMIALLFMFQYGACVSTQRIFPLLLIPVLSRACSAMCVLYLEPIGHSEYVSNEKTGHDFAYVPVGMSILALLVLLLVSGWKGLLIGLAVLAGYAVAMWRCRRSLGGVSGDLAGFSLTIAELCGLILMAAL